MTTIFLLLASCGPPDQIELITGIPNEPGGDPLVPEVALLPWPSDHFLRSDPTAATGRRVALNEDVIPDGLTPEMFARDDGFSRMSPMLAWLPGGFSPDPLPSGPEATLASTSPVIVVDMATGERIPVLAEVDMQEPEPELRTLILRPQRVLKPDTGYAVILTNGLTTVAGAPHTANDAFRALRDDLPTDSDEVEAWRQRFDPVSQAINASGVPRASVVLAWSFHTRSESQVIDDAVAIQDAMFTAPLDVWEITSDRIEGTDRLVEGTFQVPDFLDPEGGLARDASGALTAVGTRTADFLVTIPSTLPQEPRPTILFGHGFFSSKYEPTWASLNNGLVDWQMPAVTTTFIGFDEDSLGPTALILGGQLSRLEHVVAQQLQAQGHFTALARLVRGPLGEAIVHENGASVFDTDKVSYMGISNGGTQGLVLATTSPALDRAALIVAGGGWTHMLQRAVQWNELGVLVTGRYDDSREVQVVLGALQQVFDPVDSLNYISHLNNDRIPGRMPEIQTLLVEAVGDCQVNNLVTEWVAREGAFTQVSPAVRPVWGLESLPAEAPLGLPARAGYIQFDEHYPALPEGNIPPDDDNGAHETVRGLSQYRELLRDFLEDGKIIQRCDGACDPD
jgi:hypothetical protein